MHTMHVIYNSLHPIRIAKNRVLAHKFAEREVEFV